MSRAAFIALVLALVTTAGCGDDAKEESAAPPATSAAPAGPEGFEKFADCLREQGVELPSPGQGPSEGGADPPDGGAPGPGNRPEMNAKARKAMEKCQQFAPAPPGGGDGGQPPDFAQ